MQQRALTLVELLVTLALVAILAAILLTALSHARASAQAVACRSNLRQWGLATQVYGADHDDFLPPEGKPTPLESDLANPGYQAWYVQLPQQMNWVRYAAMPWRTNPGVAPAHSVFICPANRRRCNASSKTNNLFHYCLNDYVNGTGARNRRVRLASLRSAARTVWLFDSKNLPAVGGQNFVHYNLHLHGAQFVFLDSHVARFRNVDCWDFAAHRGRTNNPDLLWMP